MSACNKAISLLRFVFMIAAISLSAPISLLAIEAENIINNSGVTGGLVVHLGCGDATITSKLRPGKSYIVQGLERDMAKVDAARTKLFVRRQYGPITILALTSDKLPYPDNFVNLLLVSDPSGISEKEMKRVLAPLGVMMKEDSGDIVYRKPWPENMDHWTHAWGDATGNAVSRDELVAPPNSLKWLGDGPLWPRNHDWTPSLSSMVSADGRIFYIYDYSPSGIDDDIPNQFYLIARDAFNGALLWKKKMDSWDSRDLCGKNGHKAGGRWGFPPHISKRLVAVGDQVYVTLGLLAPVSVLDAATGEIVKTLDETDRTDEILHADGTLYLSRNLNAPDSKAPRAKEVLAINPKNGELLWKKSGFQGIKSGLTSDPQGRLELTVGEHKVFLATDQHVIALNRANGEESWKFSRPERKQLEVYSLPNYETMVYADGVLLFAQQERRHARTYYLVPTYLYALDEKTGKKLWEYDIGTWGISVPTELFVIDGKVWGHRYLETELGAGYGKRANIPATSKQKGFFPIEHDEKYYLAVGIDPHTGEVTEKLSTWSLFKGEGHHHRCWRNRCTVNYLMMSWRGAEFIDMKTGEAFKNHWARGDCLYGMMPANGLLYVPPNPCNCFSDVKMYGFLALSGQDLYPKPFKPEHPLIQGPAYNLRSSSFKLQPSKDWPIYRHNPARSGATSAETPNQLASTWTSDLPGAPGPMTMADNMLYTTLPDPCAVVALDGDNGKIAWTRIVGARVPLPPTMHQGLALVGSDDGYLRAFNAKSGALAWRLRIAPADHIVGDKGRLASAWPVHSSPLIFDGLAWVCAGRSTYIDHGIYVLGVNPATGEVVHAIRQDSRETPREWVDTGELRNTKGPARYNYREVVGNLGQILNSDGGAVYLRHRKIHGDKSPISHRMIASSAFTDPTMFNRSSWVVGNVKTSGLLVFNKQIAWGVEIYQNPRRGATFHIGEDSYKLYALRLPQKPAGEMAWWDRGAPGFRPTLKRQSKNSAILWHKTLPIRATGLVHADGKLFIAGAPDVFDSKDPLAMFQGRTEAKLLVWNDQDGEQIAEIKLAAPPVWDGMIAADGKLFISCMDGKVRCLSNNKQKDK